MEIIIGGDFYPGHRIEDDKVLNSNSVFDEDLKDYFKSSDLNIINLETPLTKVDDKFKISKTGPNLKAKPETIKLLNDIDIVTLSNNHIMDYGKKGLGDTINLCKDNNIDFVGAGKNISEASKPLIKIIKDTKIAIINISENEWSTADKNKAGANPLNPVANFYQIKEAKEKADIVIVIVHGGHEHYKYPSPRMVDTYQYFVDCGADAVIGHHTHIYSGYGVYNNAPIFYGLGNFLFDWKNRPDSWYKGFLVSLKISSNKNIYFELIPYKQCINEPKIELLNKKEKQEFEQDINLINSVIQDRKKLQYEFDKFIKLKQNYILETFSTANFFTNKYIKGAIKKLNLSFLFYRKRQLKTILNLVRCESHHDVVINVLKKYLSK